MSSSICIYEMLPITQDELDHINKDLSTYPIDYRHYHDSEGTPLDIEDEDRISVHIVAEDGFDFEGIRALIDGGFTVKKELSYCEFDWDALFRDVGFSDEEIKEGIDATRYEMFRYYFKSKDREIEVENHKTENPKYYIVKKKKYFIYKKRKLFDSTDEVYSTFREGYFSLRDICGKLGHYEMYSYLKVDNDLLAELEVPFLIFNRYKGRTFMQISD